MELHPIYTMAEPVERLQPGRLASAPSAQPQAISPRSPRRALASYGLAEVGARGEEVVADGAGGWLSASCMGVARRRPSTERRLQRWPPAFPVRTPVPDP